MDLIQAIVLGLVQGLTEFLPISSSGHLLLVPLAFGWEDPGAGFTAVIQLGTVLAVLIYFWRDLAGALVGWARSLTDAEVRRTSEAKLGWAVVIGTIPIVIAGLLLETEIDQAFRSPMVVAVMLIGVAAVMAFAELIGRRKRTLADVEVRDGVWIGLIQTLALIPGASRSGTTIAGGLFFGMDRPTAARFSFLLSVPSVLGSGLYKLVKEWDVLFVNDAFPTLVATAVSFISGFAAIAFLIGFLQSHSTVAFIVYRVALGGLIFALIGTGVMR